MNGPVTSTRFCSNPGVVVAFVVEIAAADLERARARPSPADRSALRVDAQAGGGFGGVGKACVGADISCAQFG